MNKIPVAILGATGPVGQKAITLLDQHPLFEVTELAASEGSAGHGYGERVLWKNEVPLPASMANKKIISLLDVKAKFVVSALPADVAQTVEPALAERGHIVCSNASAFRMHDDVPLVIPEINIDHFSLLANQKTTGKIITNPNCAAVFLACALAPLRSLGEFDHVSAVTMQAISGAGYPGVASFDILGNLIPYIGGAEEEKVRKETKKILGQPGKELDFGLTVHVNRVPVLHGHTVVTHVKFKTDVAVEEALRVLQEHEKKVPNYLKIYTQMDRPQPLRDITPHDMRVHIGRLKQGDRSDTIGFISMGHNLVRGAAGAAVAILEAYVQRFGAK